MARPTTKPRLPALDPKHEVLQFVRAVHEQWLRMGAFFERAAPGAARELADAQLKRTRLYRDLLQVAEYAVRGGSEGPTHINLLCEHLDPLLQGPLLPTHNLSTILESIDPDDEADPMKLLLAAAVARVELDAGRCAITSAQLAILAGVTRRHVGAEIREGKLEAEVAGRRGTAGAALIRPEEARRWLRLRALENGA